MSEGRETNGRFSSGWCPDRGRGKRPAPAPTLEEHLRRLVIATANLPVSIPRGRGRRVVTLYEAQIRRIATGHVYRRAAVMDFIRLVHSAAATSPAPPTEQPQIVKPPAGIVRVSKRLEELRQIAQGDNASELDRAAATFYELLLDLVRSRLDR